VIGKKWYMDIGDDVMHHIGKDLHVNVAGDIFYTGGATVQAKIDKDVSLKAGGDLGIDIGGKTSLKSAQDINVQSEQAKITFKTSTGDVVIEAMNVKIKGATNVAVEATAGASLKCGGSFVNVGPSGVDISGPMVNINSGGSAGSADSAPDASPKAPEEAKKPEDLTKSEYDDKFKDPLPKSDGGNS
jgi:type VI secretion system secreted protein VgrG